jgi:hypothetical protein
MVRLEELDKFKIFSDFIGTQTRDLPACTIARQQSTLPHVPYYYSRILEGKGRCLVWGTLYEPGEGQETVRNLTQDNCY